MTERTDVNFTSEWDLKAFILNDKPDPRPQVNVIMRLLYAEQAAGRWTLEFVDEAFGNDFFNTQGLFDAMPKWTRRRFVVSVMLRHTPENEVKAHYAPFRIGKRYRLENLIGLEISEVGGIYGLLPDYPTLVE